MSCAKCKIADEDLQHAIDYLRRKMALEPEWFRFKDKVEKIEAKEDLDDCARARCSHSLGRFCERWLDYPRWRKLSSAIATRKSKATLGKRSLNLDDAAYALIKRKSEEWGKSLSETVIHGFAPAHGSPRRGRIQVPAKAQGGQKKADLSIPAKKKAAGRRCH
jgi:hypothetical protein